MKIQPVGNNVLCVLSRFRLSDPMDCSPPGSSVHGILQARILEWVAYSFSRGNLPNPGIKLGCPALQANSLPAELPGMPVGNNALGQIVPWT